MSLRRHVADSVYFQASNVRLYFAGTTTLEEQTESGAYWIELKRLSRVLRFWQYSAVGASTSFTTTRRCSTQPLDQVQPGCMPEGRIHISFSQFRNEYAAALFP